MMGVAAFQTVVIDEDLQLALAHRRAVEMRQVIDRGPGGVHRRLIHQVDLAEKIGVAGDREGQRGDPAEERHPRGAVLLDQRGHLARELVDGPGVYVHTIPLPVSKCAVGCHSKTLQYVQPM